MLVTDRKRSPGILLKGHFSAQQKTDVLLSYTALTELIGL